MIPTNWWFRRALVGLCVVLALLVIVMPGSASAQDDAEPESADCSCERVNACYHYLNAPVDPPEGPCWCPDCDPKRPHAGNKAPKGWNRQCFGAKQKDCFLKRHSASWRLICSACTTDEGCCKFKNPELCPKCGDGDGKSPFGRDAAKRAAEQFAIEREVFKKRKPIVLWSRRFYVVTDMQKIQINTQGGGLRWVHGHEYAHIMLERAEKAYRDFQRGVGRARIGRPIGIFLPAQDTVGRKIKLAYFRNPRSHMIYGALGGSVESNIGGGFCVNGLCVSQQAVGGKDRGWHQAVRHNLAHIFISNWIKTQGENQTLPRWMYSGAGHWLGKLPEFLRDDVFYCEGEARRVGGSGKNWLKKLSDKAKRGSFDPLEELLGKTSLGQLTHADHVRSWGIFHLALAEWRRPFVSMLTELRKEKDVRWAFTERLGVTPEEFDQRWIDRLAGKLDHLDPGQAKKRGTGGGAKPEASLGGENDPKKLAALIRGKGPPKDAAHAAELFGVIAAHDSDLVRETAFQALIGAKEAAAREAVWTVGLPHGNRTARAYAARVVRFLRLKGAKEANRKALDDLDWFVRAEAALAAAAIQDYDAQAKVRAMVEGASAKGRIGAMDALRNFGEAVNLMCVPIIAKNLDHKDWQVRIACCQALGDLGDERAVGPLVARMQKEAGRVAEEIRAALKEITGDDLGRNPAHWKDWWKNEEARVKERGGFITGKKEKADPDEPDRYGRPVPKYYGVKLFSARVGYVLDISGSTDREFALDPDTAKRLEGMFKKPTILAIAQAEIVRSLGDLDPRTRVGIVAFSTAVFRWKNGTVPLTPGNRNSAEGFVKNKNPKGETNFHGALEAVLDLDGERRNDPQFGDTPDTLTFLTDGSPTAGDITDPDTLRDWYTELNRYARIRTHVIAFGSLGVDEKLLSLLAEANGGRFVQIRESHER